MLAAVPMQGRIRQREHLGARRDRAGRRRPERCWPKSQRFRRAHEAETNGPRVLVTVPMAPASS